MKVLCIEFKFKVHLIIAALFRATNHCCGNKQKIVHYEKIRKIFLVGCCATLIEELSYHFDAELLKEQSTHYNFFLFMKLFATKFL